MKIGIDISPIVYGSGVSVYLKNLAKALLQTDKTNHYTFFFSSLRQKIQSSKFKVQNSKFKILRYKIPPTLLDILWNRLHILPIEYFVGKLDVFHASDWTQPPAKSTKLVTTIHDLSFLRWPETVHPKVLSAQKRRLQWVKKEADMIIAVSEATKEEIVKLLGVRPKKIKVVYEAAPADTNKFKVKNLKLKILKKKLGISKLYFIAYGSQAPRKNIKRLIDAFKTFKLRNRNFQLVITGEYEINKQDQLFGSNLDIVVTGFLPRKDYLNLLAGSFALAYPSLYEGFGLPILEAFNLKVPVLTSNCSSMAEIAGDAAVLVDPYSIESITEGMEKICDDSVRRNLAQAGEKRVKDFSWKKAAKETLAIYNTNF